jgi:uncharacterized protein (DUF924 family)
VSVSRDTKGDSAAIRDILDFWFLPLGDPEHGTPRKLWWESTPEIDSEIRFRFGALSDRAIAGELDHWRRSPDGALALTLLCDQFTRNIHRKTARAFSGDAKARETARYALAHCYPAAYGKDVRLFFYMPFQHSEDLGDQDFCCTLFATLGNADNEKHATEHRDIVARFGRFPHRNEVLGRASTEDELNYLKTAKRFGQ